MLGSSLPVCAVVPVHGDTSALANVYRQLRRAGVHTCITVLNGTAPPLSAAAATEQAADLGLQCITLAFTTPLGPDVPRAVGAVAAMRKSPATPWLLFVDGDWQGGFGPLLSEFIAQAEPCPGVWFQAVPDRLAPGTPPQRPCRQRSSGLEGQGWVRGDWRWGKRPDLQVWQYAWQHPGWPGPGRGANPAEPPWLVHRRVFVDISPLWLHHPGLWYACCVAAARRGLVSLTAAPQAVASPEPAEPAGAE
ncbi:MAG: hypothetical protein K6T31_06215 [Alicyclobacillus sp.]|nr:hypothetical protein [Alicyclobacillus sp.]